jgi:hypothetical protein
VFNNLATSPGQDVGPFAYHHLGSFAYVGGKSAVAEFDKGWILSGFSTWYDDAQQLQFSL